jgi:SAM-dependent methyltransferase
MNKQNYLDQLLNAFWLRPETALWRAIDIQAMANFQFESPSLDFGSGDGMFSFIRAGGQLSSDFDAFKATAGLDKFFEDVDVFDAFDPKLSPLITKKPDYQIDVAFDHKQNLLSKAATLGLFKELKVGDGNQPLPFGNDSFASIFSNIVYWLDDPKSVLAELARILKPGGKICLMLPNRTLPEFSFFKSLAGETNPDWAFLSRLDRGRLSDNVKQAKSAEEWQAIFGTAGLSVHEHHAHLSKTVIQMWDVGMRPLFPVLMKMANAIPEDKIDPIKSDWIATFKHFLEPISKMDSTLTQGQEPAFHCYILTK